MKTTIEPRRGAMEVLNTLSTGAYFRYQSTSVTDAMHTVVCNAGCHSLEVTVMNLDTRRVFCLRPSFAKQTVDVFEAVEFTFRQK